MCVYVLECLHLRRPAEATGSSGAEGTEGSELSDCGNRSQVFYKSSKSTLNHRAFSNLELIDKHFLKEIQNPRFILDWVSLKFEEVPVTYTYKALIL